MRKYIIGFWICILLFFGIFLLGNPSLIEPSNLANFVESFGALSLVIYSLIFFFRGLLLVPSTPLILAGMLLFPDNPHAVFAISMTGIIFSALIIYKFSDILGLDDQYAHNVKSKKIKAMIEKYGFYAVAFWSFFLVLPTDLICYIAGAVRMNIYKFILAVALGEAFIIGIFIYWGKSVFEYFSGFFL